MAAQPPAPPAPDLMGVIDALRLLRTVLESEIKPSRELSLALTRLEECGMWAAAAFALQNGAAATRKELDDYAELGDAMRSGFGFQFGGKPNAQT